MPYFGPDHIKLALQYLPDHTHASLLSLLAMLREGVPAQGAAGAVPFGSAQEHALLDQYFKPPGGTEERPWYLPFGKSKPGYPHWKTADYGGSSLQRMRTGKAWIYPAVVEGGKAVAFGLPPDLPEVIKARHKEVFGAVPLSTHHLAAWVYRDAPFPSHAAAVQRFVAEFHLEAYGLAGDVFSTLEDPALSAIPLAPAPATAADYHLLLEPQPQGAPKAAAAGDGGAGEPVHAAPEDEDASGGTWDVHAEPLKAALAGLVGVEEAALQALAALRSGMHVVMTGAPGSGKTELARRICKAAEFTPWIVTATDSWTTFETIGGYFPKIIDGKELLDFEPGLISSAIKEEKVLVIDELNRADIDKAFGELFTLLSGNSVNLPFRRQDGGGGPGKPIRLLAPGDHDPGDAEIIAVPDWWRIVGTMNDADKTSLKRLSFAFMRRFAFVPVPLPEPATYGVLIEEASVSSGLSAKRPEFVQSLRAIFAASGGLRGLDLGVGFAIPKSMIHQALAELGLDPGRPAQVLLGSGLELYLAPQLQGRADKHNDVLNLVGPHLDAASLHRFALALANWTGFVA